VHELDGREQRTMPDAERKPLRRLLTVGDELPMTWRALVVVAGALAIGGCSQDVCANVQGTCVALHIDGGGSVSTVQITATFVGQDATGAGAMTATNAATGDATSLPVVMPVRFHSGISGAVPLAVTATLSGSPVGYGTTTVQVIDGQHTTGAVILQKSNATPDAGAELADFGTGGTGGTGGGPGGCTPATCPSGMYCATDGTCQPAQMVSLGGACDPNNAMQVCRAGGHPAACAPDGVCRATCAGNPDCSSFMPMTACFQFGGAGQGYCSLNCNAVPPSPTQNGCMSGMNCVILDYTSSVTDCVKLDGKNLSPGTTCQMDEDCNYGETCYVKAGQASGTCWGNCFSPGAACQFPANGTCQAPTGSPKFGVCCPSGMTCS